MTGFVYAGVSPSGKAAGFDPAIRRFESFHPSQYRCPVQIGTDVGERTRFDDTMALFTGNANPALAQDIARHLQVPLGSA